MDGRGRLRVGGCDLVDLADRYGTPLYVLDEATVRERARAFTGELGRQWPGPSTVVFASKAYPSAVVGRILASEGVGCDVASSGELAVALRAGFPPDRIVVHGNAKSDADVRAALAAGVGWVVVDNLDDVDRLERFAERPQAVLVRVRPGIDAPTHEAVATGGEDSKFGLGPAEARAAIDRIRSSRHLRLDGVHVHVGSQILDTRPFADSVRAVAGLGEFPVYDLGGGLGVRYTYAEHPPTVEAYVRALAGTARRALPGTATLLIEPGRAMVARAGVTLYRVQTVKRGRRTFVGVDGGMGDNLEVSLFGTRFEATVADRVTGGGEVCQLVGHHCESGDRLIDGVPLEDPQVGDVIAVPVTGAYTFTMANNYNLAPRPAMVVVHDGRDRLAVRRETLDDLWSRDVAG